MLIHSSVMYLPDRIRDDHLSDAGQQEFRTSGPVRSNVVDVYRNGLLQRSDVDYTEGTVPGAYRVVFLSALSPGDYVTLFYYR